VQHWSTRRAADAAWSLSKGHPDMHQFERLVLDDDRITAFVGALRENYVNGGVLFASFDSSAAGPHWFRAHPQASVADARFGSFLGSSVLRQALPELGLYRGAEFTPEYLPALVLDGYLAYELVRGGAYAEFAGTPAEAKGLAAGFYSALFDDRYLEVACFKTVERWSEWFQGDWDGTWIMVDQAKQRVHVLCITDRDV
jgi:hypothetical protein